VTFNSDWLFGYLSRIVNGWRGGSAAAAPMDGSSVCVIYAFSVSGLSKNPSKPSALNAN